MMRMSGRERMPQWTSAVVVVAMLTGAVAYGAGAPPQVLVWDGDPTTLSGEEHFELTFRHPVPAVVGETGDVYFLTYFHESLGDAAIYRGDPNDLVEVVRGSGVRGVIPGINNEGHLVFTASISASVRGVFRHHGTDLKQLAATGDSVPGGDGLLAPRTVFPSVNDSGQVAFGTWLTGTSGGSADNRAVYRSDEPQSPLVEIVRKGQLAPDGNGTIGELSFDLDINDVGQVAFRGAVSGSGDIHDQGIFRGDGGPLVQVARKGEIAPGGDASSPHPFYRFWEPRLNDSGETAFVGDYRLGSSSGNGVFRGNGQALTPVARTGYDVPGIGGRFSSISRNIDFNDAGQVLFASSISPEGGGTSGGLFRGDRAGGLTVIAADGEPMPGGGVFDGVDWSGNRYALNESGQVAFVAYDDEENRGLFFYEDATGITEILREGRTLVLLDGENPVIGSVTDFRFEGVGPATYHTEEYTGLNDRGQVTFAFELADGRVGIALWTPILVTEPDCVRDSLECTQQCAASVPAMLGCLLGGERCSGCPGDENCNFVTGKCWPGLGNCPVERICVLAGELTPTCCPEGSECGAGRCVWP